MSGRWGEREREAFINLESIIYASGLRVIDLRETRKRAAKFVISKIDQPVQARTRLRIVVAYSFGKATSARRRFWEMEKHMSIDKRRMCQFQHFAAASTLIEVHENFIKSQLSSGQKKKKNNVLLTPACAKLQIRSDNSTEISEIADVDRLADFHKANVSVCSISRDMLKSRRNSDNIRSRVSDNNKKSRRRPIWLIGV